MANMLTLVATKFSDFCRDSRCSFPASTNHVYTYRAPDRVPEIAYFPEMTAHRSCRRSDRPTTLTSAAALMGRLFGRMRPFVVAVSLSISSGRYSTLVPAMQTLGAAIGPTVAGMLIVIGSFAPVYIMSTTAWLLTLVLFIAANKRLRAG